MCFARLCLLVAVCVASCLPAMATEPYVTGTVAQSVYALPLTDTQYYLTVVGYPGDPRYVELCKTLETSPTFAEIKAGTHYHNLPTTSRMFRGRYQGEYSETPAIRLQKPDGTIAWESNGKEFTSADEILTELEAQCIIRRILDRRQQPTPCPVPAPAPAPSPTPDPYIPPKRPVTPRSSFPWMLCIAAGVVGAGIGAVEVFKRSQEGSY